MREQRWINGAKLGGESAFDFRFKRGLGQGRVGKLRG
jgi:hypothetical protein